MKFELPGLRTQIILFEETKKGGLEFGMEHSDGGKDSFVLFDDEAERQELITSMYASTFFDMLDKF